LTLSTCAAASRIRARVRADFEPPSGSVDGAERFFVLLCATMPKF
jgi:hypothetical protein